jgi:hypothetical protein
LYINAVNRYFLCTLPFITGLICGSENDIWIAYSIVPFFFRCANMLLHKDYSWICCI